MKKNSKIVFVVSIVVLLLALSIFIALRNVNTYQISSFTWRDEIEPVDYMNIRNFADNNCNLKYYSPSFKIENGILYDYFNNEIKDNAFSIVQFTHGDCDIQETFVTLNNGDLIYVNNLEDTKYKKYELLAVPNLSRILKIQYDEEGNVEAVDYTDTPSNVNKYLVDIIDLGDIEIPVEEMEAEILMEEETQ